MDFMKSEPDYEKERRRRRREFVIIGILAVAIPALLYAQHRLIPLPIPGSAQILFFSLVNLDVLLILFLLFLVLRNTVKLIVERRKGILGSSLRTKIVIAFVALSFIPMAFLLYTASNFVRMSVQMWFGQEVERTLAQSMEVAESYYESVRDSARVSAEEIGRDVESLGVVEDEQLPALHDLLTKRLKQFELDHIELRMRDGRSITRMNVDKASVYLETPQTMVQRALLGGVEDEILPFQNGEREMVKVAVPVHMIDTSRVAPSAKSGDAFVASPGGSGDRPSVVAPYVAGVLIVSTTLPQNLVAKIHQAEQTYREYLATRQIRVPLNRGQQQTILVIIGLLSLFSATWIGFHLSGWLTVPIRELSKATQRLAAGDFGFKVNLQRSDEMGILLDSFNRMSSDLKRSSDEVESAHREVRRRAHHTEAILASVASGVLTIEANGRVSRVNPALARMLNLDPATCAGRPYAHLLPELAEPLESMILDLQSDGRKALDRELSFKSALGVRTFRVGVTRLHEGEEGEWVVVFDDVSDLIRAQKDTAWREVAKRIAHEIKNPLTPIQLSAQRLRKKYPSLMEEAGSPFDECTATIISQVEEMKTLVNVLTDLARIPPFQPAECDVRGLVDDILSLYRQAHPLIRFEFLPDGIERVTLDRQQMRRALINLVDNAVSAVQDEGGTIRIRFESIDRARRMRILIEDSGVGVPEELREKIFEPYFSFGKKGMGLGLPIVKRIVEDHSGTIAVGPNAPTGSVFQIEIPIEA